MRFCAQTLCFFTILIAAKGSGIAQLRYKSERAVSLLKASIICFDVSGGGVSRET